MDLGGLKKGGSTIYVDYEGREGGGGKSLCRFTFGSSRMTPYHFPPENWADPIYAILENFF